MSAVFLWGSTERRTRDRKVASSNLGRGGGRIFFSRVNFVCNSYSVSVPHTPFLHPVLPQWLVKGLGQSSKSAGGRLHLFTHTPFTQRSRSGLTMPLSRHSVGTYPETSSKPTCHGTFGHRTSQLDKLLWPDPGIPSGISVRELISIHTHTQKKKKNTQAGNEWSNRSV